MNRSAYVSGEWKKPKFTVYITEHYAYTEDSDGLKQGVAKLFGLGEITYVNDKVIHTTLGDFDHVDYDVSMGSGQVNHLNLKHYTPFFDGFGKRNPRPDQVVYIGIGYVRLK